MEHKPWPLLILAFIHLIEPISKIIFYSLFFNITPSHVVLSVYQSETLLHFLEFLFLFPIAGIAIYSVKRWSLPVFLIVEAWVFYINASYLNDLYQTQQLWLFGSFVLFGLLNLAIVTYLLIPAVRIAYLDPHVRWWEAQPRYSVNLDCVIDNKMNGFIKNISADGVFIKTENDLAIDSDARLIFKFTAPSMEFSLNTKIQVLHKFNINDVTGYGAKFVGLSKDNKHFINALIKFLDKSNVERRPPHRNLKSFIRWFTTLIKTGEGLVMRNKLNSMHR